MALTPASITTIREAKTTVNLCSEFMTFNEDTIYTVSSGSGNVEVSNSADYAMYGNKSLKIRFTGTGQATVNFGMLSESTLKEAIRHIVSMDVYKDTPDAAVSLILEVYLGTTLTLELNCDVFNSGGFMDDRINTFFGIFNPLADDVISFKLKAQSDTTNVIVYIDGLKVEADRFAAQYPSLYSEPPFKTLKWQQRSDYTNTQTLDADTETDYAFVGTTVTKNVDGTILNTSGFSVPTKLNTLITRSGQFTAVVPSGSNKHIHVKLLVNDVVVREKLHKFQLTAGDDEPIEFIFDLPVDQTVLDNQCKIVLEPNASTVIKNRLSLHKEVANA